MRKTLLTTKPSEEAGPLTINYRIQSEVVREMYNGNTQNWAGYPKYSKKQAILTWVIQNDSATSSLLHVQLEALRSWRLAGRLRKHLPLVF